MKIHLIFLTDLVFRQLFGLQLDVLYFAVGPTIL